jgi:hypothetical protein
MTAGAGRMIKRRPRRLAVASLAAVLFLLAALLLAWQLSAGRDPLLRHGVATASAAPRTVIVRKIVERIVITRMVPAGGGGGTIVSSSTAVAGAPAVATAAPVATRAS